MRSTTSSSGSWLGPLLLIRNAIDDERLGVQEKISLLTLGLSDIADVAALQITLVGVDLPLLVTKDDISQRLRDAGLEPLSVLRTPPARGAGHRPVRRGWRPRTSSTFRRPTTGSPRSCCR